MAQEKTYATGKRKTAIARVWLKPGSGKVAVNAMEPAEYFGNLYYEPKLSKPFAVTNTTDSYDVVATVAGGGKSAQVDALVHGIARALQEVDPEMRHSLKKASLLTRDPRGKERKK